MYELISLLIIFFVARNLIIMAELSGPTGLLFFMDFLIY